MALFEISHLNKHKNWKTRVTYCKGSFGIDPKGLGNTIFVKMHKYEYSHPILPPTLLELEGKKYLMPYWKEVHPKTEISDIVWKKPVKKKKEIIKHEFLSSKGDVTYVTKEIIHPNGEVTYTCNCPGFWRAKKEIGCKHVKGLRK